MLNRLIDKLWMNVRQEWVVMFLIVHDVSTDVQILITGLYKPVLFLTCTARRGWDAYSDPAVGSSCFFPLTFIMFGLVWD